MLPGWCARLRSERASPASLFVLIRVIRVKLRRHGLHGLFLTEGNEGNEDPDLICVNSCQGRAGAGATTPLEFAGINKSSFFVTFVTFCKKSLRVDLRGSRGV